MKRPGLAGILYAINLAVGIILSIPIFVAFAAAISDSGFSPEMSEQFDIALWADMLEETGPIFQILMGQLIWMIPLIYIWKVASSVAVVYAVQGSGEGIVLARHWTAYGARPVTWIAFCRNGAGHSDCCGHSGHHPRLATDWRSGTVLGQLHLYANHALHWTGIHRHDA